MNHQPEESKMYRQALCNTLHIIPASLILACTSAESPGPGTTEATATTGTGQGPEVSPPVPTSSGDTSTTTTDALATTSSTSAATDTTDTTASTAPVAMCGDGQVDDGEECDDGLNNRDDGACKLDCTAAVCGDGKVWDGMEVCDNGPDNGDAYSGCSLSCTKNASCGDSNVDTLHGEICDDGPLNGSGLSETEGNAPCTAGCVWDARVVFATSTLLDGNIGHGEDPLLTADAICKARAAAGKLPRASTYMAWLADGTQSPLERFTLLPPKPYVLRTGERVADTLTDLVVDGPIEGFRVDEYGAPIPSSYVWTGTLGDGTYDPAVPCGGWQSASNDLAGLAGLSHVPHIPEDEWDQWMAGKHWTEYIGWKCSKEARLLCFEQ